MAELLEASQALESTTIYINRTSTVVKGGRRFSFSALVVVGDRRGSVGIGYGKAPGVPAAIEKAQKDARKNLVKVTLRGSTISHPVRGRFGASTVLLVPAAPGTGVIAGGTVRAVLEMAGVQDILSKAHGSTRQINLCQAVMNGLQQLRTKDQVAKLRGVELEKTEVEAKIESAQKFLSDTADQAAPLNGGKAPAPQPAKPKTEPSAKPAASAQAAEAQSTATAEPEQPAQPEASEQAPQAEAGEQGEQGGESSEEQNK